MTTPTPVETVMRKVRIAVAGHAGWPTGKVDGAVWRCDFGGWRDPALVVDLRLAVAVAVAECGGRARVTADIWQKLAQLAAELHAGATDGDPDPMGSTCVDVDVVVPLGFASRDSELVSALEAWGMNAIEGAPDDCSWLHREHGKALVDNRGVWSEDLIGREMNGKTVIDVIGCQWAETHWVWQVLLAERAVLLTDSPVTLSTIKVVA